MSFKEFIRPTLGKIILAIIIFILINIFLFPAIVNVYCKVGALCPPVLVFAPIYKVINEPTFISPSYLILLIELLIIYYFSCYIIRPKKSK